MKKFDKSDLIINGLFFRNYEEDESYFEYSIIVPSLNISNFPFKNLDIILAVLDGENMMVNSLGIDDEIGLCISFTYVSISKSELVKTFLSCLNSLSFK